VATASLIFTVITALTATALRAPGAALVIVVVVIFAAGIMPSVAWFALTATGLVTFLTMLSERSVGRERPDQSGAQVCEKTDDRHCR